MRKTIIVLVCCTVVLLLGYCGYRAFGLWKQSHFMAMAKQFADKGDASNEALSLQQVLNSNPRNVEATRMMADLAEASRSPNALHWREKVVEFAPNSLSDRLALAQTAVFVQNLDVARDTLSKVDDAGKNARFYNISGEIALMTGKPTDAESDFAQAVRLDPAALAPQLSLAVVQLHSSNTLDMAEARINLKRISMNSTNAYARTQARRELTIDALRNNDNNGALYYSKELITETNLAFEDHLLRLDALRLTKSDQYNSYLASCEREAAADPGKLSAMSIWLLERHLPAQVLSWLQSQPANIRTNLPAALVISQCQMLTGDWKGLQATLSQGNWGGLEFTRHAYMARALRQQGLNAASKAEWDAAMTSANNAAPAGVDANLTSLLRNCAEWNWQEEGQEILWAIFNKFPQEQWAGQKLMSILYSSGSTRPLMELFSTLSQRYPDNLDFKNNLAMTAMLLRAQEVNSYDLAHDVYEKAPTNSQYACTYAFALHLQGKDADALKIMQKIPAKDLGDGSTAGYYGLILKSTGDTADAKTYLTRSVRGQLLPEERAMFQRATAGL